MLSARHAAVTDFGVAKAVSQAGADVVEGGGARQTSARVVSFVVSFVRLPAHRAALRYDTDAHNTA